ncbi:enterochelin esterase-like enzyme [Dysgonomonas sp. PFB1-18]|uniref:alpha/beta hydrolase n=1 Tax=unclassified Dysgonomonas TaxID=2630389 RepID=UPI002473116E|nr:MULTISPECIES: alpha/beta hydrolase-fold protein [unclassified Dysgonomonas]MDH6309942.1 enterochelin esterase-like enzyme [Dysgonomonas sp. PF1-14]MDH6339485.1 enterochelin esterase-like enzyme [Dysgonomonas sp. PF1-16]MDH6380986.1 enterochelin esterase-like enzyme [Dysgonomonas sp. PFB1-18]MDH6397995.1 enterochelin esterase-like enzyme [Dysgonomonas sp. PF1-23]
MKRIELLVLLLLAALISQAQPPYPQSRIETKTIKSEVLSADREYTIFLPKSYDTDTSKKYPVLYLLHGMMQTNNDWFHRGYVKDVMDQLTASGEASEMIIVSPNAGGDMSKGHWNGYFDMPGWKYETFFFTEFLPYIEKTYRAIGNKQSRAVAGLSMGGGGATAYGQRHSDMFGAVYAMSALMSIPEEGAHRFDDPNSLMAILTRSVIENSCVKYVEEADEQRKAQLRTVAWFVDCGDDDFLLDRNIELTQAMRKGFIPCEFRVRDGGHTWEYWHSALYTCLPFVSRSFNK